MKNEDRFVVEVFIDDKPVLARYDYDPGEDQWFDARAGVGSPGYPPELQVTEVNFGTGWEPVENYPQLNIEAIEQAAMDKEDEIAREYWEGYAESFKEEA